MHTAPYRAPHTSPSPAHCTQHSRVSQLCSVDPAEPLATHYGREQPCAFGTRVEEGHRSSKQLRSLHRVAFGIQFINQRDEAALAD